MKKLFLIIFIFLALGIGMYFVYILFLKEEALQPVAPQGTAFPVVPPVHMTPGQNTGDARIPMRTTDGQIVSVRDFRTDDFVEPLEGNYYLLPDTLSGAEPSFEMLYSGTDGGIIISLLEQPLEDARRKAEEELMRYLDVSRRDLCRLSISIGVTIHVDENYAGQELGVSGCDGSVEL